MVNKTVRSPPVPIPKVPPVMKGYVTIDGDIGSGKSTVMRYIAAKYGLPIHLEPVETWETYLDAMYNGLQKPTPFEFQVRIWLDQCFPKLKCIIERSPFFTQSTFVNLMRERSMISYSEYGILNELYALAIKAWTPTVYIYLRSNPDNCYNRMILRSRDCEKRLDLNYMKDLHKLHQSAFMYATMMGVPVMAVDVENRTVEDIGDEVYRIMKHFQVI